MKPARPARRPAAAAPDAPYRAPARPSGLRRRRRLLLLAPALVSATMLPAAGDARAQPGGARADAWVSQLQMPAWLDRAGQTVPLSPGAALRGGDVLRTGPGGRVQVRMAEGSTMRLGESARLSLDDLRVTRGGTTLLAGLFEVARGAFRFTTAAVARGRSQRDLQIRISTVTAGVRGTDLWGRGNAEREIVCLIEGRITVERGSDPPIVMDQPLSFYVAPAGSPALPVAPVDPAQLAEWARETEPVAGAGLAVPGGRWRVSTYRGDDERVALESFDALRSAGYDARIRTRRGAQGAAYDVGIGGLSSQSEARGLAGRLEGQPGAASTPLVERT